MGINYLFGLSNDANPEKAIKYLTKATKSAQYAGLAACCLGTAYLHGTGVVTQEAKQIAENTLSTGIQDGQDWHLTDKDRETLIEICKDGYIKQNFELAIHFFKLGIEKGKKNASQMLEDTISYLEEKVANIQEVSNASDEAQVKAVHSLYQYHFEQAEFYKNKCNIVTRSEANILDAFGQLRRLQHIIIESSENIIYPDGLKTQENQDGCSRYLYHSERVEYYKKIMHIHPQQTLSDVMGCHPNSSMGDGPNSCCVM